MLCSLARPRAANATAAAAQGRQMGWVEVGVGHEYRMPRRCGERVDLW